MALLSPFILIHDSFLIGLVNFIQFLCFFWYCLFSLEWEIPSELRSMLVFWQFLCHVAIDVYHHIIFDFYELLKEIESAHRSLN